MIAIAAVGYFLWKKSRPTIATARAPAVATVATAAAGVVDGTANNPPSVQTQQAIRNAQQVTWGETTTTQVTAPPLAVAAQQQLVGAMASFGGTPTTVGYAPITPGWVVGGSDNAAGFGGGVSGYPVGFNPLQVAW